MNNEPGPGEVDKRHADPVRGVKILTLRVEDENGVEHEFHGQGTVTRGNIARKGQPPMYMVYAHMRLEES